jgi:tRNA threonylcarbamoyl adenosine modification protein YeaZ
MLILAIDTSNQPLSVALLQNEKLLATVTINSRQKDHSSLLFPALNEMFMQAGLKIQQINRIAIAKGPGSYTGLRIGGTAAKTLAYTLKKELVSISSLAVLAAPLTPLTPLAKGAVIVPLFDAKRQNVFAGVYHQGSQQLEKLVEDCHLSLTELGERLQPYSQITFVGSDSHRFTEFFKEHLVGKKLIWAAGIYDYPQAYQLGLLAFKERPLENIHNYVPTYLRLTQAEKQWQKNHREQANEPLVERF